VRNDGTVRWGGGYLEVRPELSGKIELRFDPRDDSFAPQVFVGNRFYCDTVPLDRVANAHRVRRRVTGEPAPGVEPTGINPLALLIEEHAQSTKLMHLAEHDDEQDEEDS
jgi:hypothetical protein